MRNKKRNLLIFFCVFLLLVVTVQLVRYDKERYSCRHMARDEESFLESIGFTVIIARADDYGGGQQGHMWIALDIGGVYIHFDSVSLIPIIPPENTEYYNSYEEYLKR